MHIKEKTNGAGASGDDGANEAATKPSAEEDNKRGVKQGDKYGHFDGSITQKSQLT